MKTRKQIVKEFLDQKAKDATIAIEKKEAIATDKGVVASFYKALANRDASALKELQGEIAKSYDGQSIGTDANGGYLVPVELSERIREQLVYISPIRSIATVIANMPAQLDIPLENAIPTTYWVGEGVAPTLSKSTFNKITLVAHKIGGFGKFTHESLVDTAVNPDLQNFVADRFAVSLAQKDVPTKSPHARVQSQTPQLAFSHTRIWSRHFMVSTQYHVQTQFGQCQPKQSNRSLV